MTTTDDTDKAIHITRPDCRNCDATATVIAWYDDTTARDAHAADNVPDHLRPRIQLTLDTGEELVATVHDHFVIVGGENHTIRLEVGFADAATTTIATAAGGGVVESDAGRITSGWVPHHDSDGDASLRLTDVDAVEVPPEVGTAQRVHRLIEAESCEENRAEVMG